MPFRMPGAPRTLLPIVALGLLTMGCGASMPIRDDDSVFAHAVDRLERTASVVDATDAPPRERAIFMQAESFYRYRFERSSRGGMAVAAELAAAVTDFPVFQSFAGSVDLVDLRLRSADGAIHLWETFLRRYPESRLRPLALYRLGWAYRNAGAEGLPRDSGDEAFDELVRDRPPAPLDELVTAARAVPFKTKNAAAAWSLVPGLGQIYVGEPLNGLARLGIALVAAAALVTPVVIGANRADELTWGHDWPLIAIGVGGLIVLSADYTSSYQDALRGVVQWNERAERAFETSHPEAP
jgi:hypothetical protein